MYRLSALFLLAGMLAGTILAWPLEALAATGAAEAISAALTSPDAGQPIWLQVILASLPVLATVIVVAIKALGVLKDEQVRRTVLASADHGYQYVEELSRIYEGKTGIDKTAEFLKAFRDAMVAQGVGAPTQVQTDFALARAKALNAGVKARQAEVATLAQGVAAVPPPKPSVVS